MKRLASLAACVLVMTSAALAIKITLFVDTATFAERAKDIIVVACDRPAPEKDYGDGLHPVDVTVRHVLKGESPLGAMRIATIYPMLAGKTYLLASLGGSVDGITFLAVPELSVVEIPFGFDTSAMKGMTLVEQLNSVFAARKAEVGRQQQELKRETDLLEKALQKKAG